MSSEDNKILEFNQCQKPDKASFTIYADVESLIEKIDGSKRNPENYPQVGKHIPSGFSMSTISSFKSIGNKHDLYRGKNCDKKFCESLREHAMRQTEQVAKTGQTEQTAEII